MIDLLVNVCNLLYTYHPPLSLKYQSRRLAKLNSLRELAPHVRPSPPRGWAHAFTQTMCCTPVPSVRSARWGGSLSNTSRLFTYILQPECNYTPGFLGNTEVAHAQPRPFTHTHTHLFGTELQNRLLLFCSQGSGDKSSSPSDTPTQRHTPLVSGCSPPRTTSHLFASFFL